MEVYLLLLRGINVGGNNRVPMKELKDLLEQEGFSQVETYINSGNVRVTSDEQDTAVVRKQAEALIAQHFGVTNPVMVIRKEELLAAAAQMPSWWGFSENDKHNAIFVLPPADGYSVAGEVGEAKPEYEKVAVTGQVIFWTAPVETFSKTRWAKVVGSASYQKVTIRNANTFRKLLQMVKEV